MGRRGNWRDGPGALNTPAVWRPNCFVSGMRISPWRRFAAVLGLALGLTVSTAASARAAQIGLAWTDNAADEDGFLVERRPASGGGFQPLATLGPNVVGYLDTSAAPGASYCYRIRAFNVAGLSAFTNEACGTASGVAPVPLAVTLNATSFRPSDTMVATVQATAGLVPAAVDAYVVVQAGGALLSLQLDGRLVPGLVPIARGVVLPTIAAPFVFPLAGAPPGAYTWLAGVTAPGTLTLVSPIVSTPFTITP